MNQILVSALPLILMSLGAAAQRIETTRPISPAQGLMAPAVPLAAPTPPQAAPTAPRAAAPAAPAAAVPAASQAARAASGGGDPPDRFREDHGHVHAHLCDKQKCDTYCEAKEENVWANERSFMLAKRECMQYCRQDC